MEQVKASCQKLVHGGIDTRSLIEETIEFVAEVAVDELAECGVKLDPDDAYDALVEGILSAAERAAA